MGLFRIIVTLQEREVGTPLDEGIKYCNGGEVIN